MLGSGAIMVMDDTTDIPRACLRLVRFYARESCGKCTPCREGTAWEEKVLQRIVDGRGRPGDIELLESIGDNISPGPYPVASYAEAGLSAVPFPPKQTTICPLGPSGPHSEPSSGTSSWSAKNQGAEPPPGTNAFSSLPPRIP